ncbi:response regulator [Vibrio lamellibrachiae]|uniref:response regulator n=1 Tax=Vibrio lamellibrachiae TaxID=2910253 RepID=UPI003D0E0F42
MNILICDDSALARKMLARSIELLPNQNVLFAEGGQQALDLLHQYSVDVLFLDLTMPEMDGYQVLKLMPHSYPTKVVVVSGDVQAQAMSRCMDLGAYTFIQKPFSNSYAAEIFTRLGLIFKANGVRVDDISPQVKFKEIANIALGQGAASLASVLGEFIHLPIPTVSTIEKAELDMMLRDALYRDEVKAVTQRFVGSGMHGEALICLHGQGISHIGERLGFTSEDNSYNEVVLNVANLFVSSFMTSLCDQMDVSVSLRQPVVVDSRVYAKPSCLGDDTLALEFIYRDDQAFECEVLFMFDRESEQVINRVMESI